MVVRMLSFHPNIIRISCRLDDYVRPKYTIHIYIGFSSPVKDLPGPWKTVLNIPLVNNSKVKLSVQYVQHIVDLVYKSDGDSGN
jgi:hypothetical protein